MLLTSSGKAAPVTHERLEARRPRPRAGLGNGAWGADPCLTSAHSSLKAGLGVSLLQRAWLLSLLPCNLGRSPFAPSPGEPWFPHLSRWMKGDWARPGMGPTGLREAPHLPNVFPPHTLSPGAMTPPYPSSSPPVFSPPSLLFLLRSLLHWVHLPSLASASLTVLCTAASGFLSVPASALLCRSLLYFLFSPFRISASLSVSLPLPSLSDTLGTLGPMGL